MANIAMTIVEILFGAICLVITRYAVPWFKANTTTEQQVELMTWAKMAVSAAEQLYTGTGRGTEKKEYVINWLNEHNINIDETQLDALIESAVYELKNGVIVS